MEESWEEKTERLEREYQARIDRLRDELRDMEEQKLHVESRFEERVRQHEQIEYTNAALTKRVAELEAHKNKPRDLCGELLVSLQVPRLEDENAALTKRVAELEYEHERAVERNTQYVSRGVQLLERVAELERWIDCGQDGPCVKAPGCNRHWEERNRELVREVRDLQSQLAWTPVSAGLPTEPGYYLFTNKEHDVALYRQNRTLTNWKWETVQGVKRKDDAMKEAWSAYRRVELPKDGETRGCDCDTPTTVHDVACPMRGGES